MTGTWPAGTGMPGNVTFYSVPQARCRGAPTLIAGVSLVRAWEGTVLGRCWERAPWGRERGGNVAGTWPAGTGTPGNVTFYSVPEARCRRAAGPPGTRGRCRERPGT